MEVLILFIAMAKEWDQEKWDEKWDKMDLYERRQATREVYDFYDVDIEQELNVLVQIQMNLYSLKRK